MRSQYYVFTLNAWTNEEEQALQSLCESEEVITFCTYGRETAPTTGQRHLQGYIEFSQRLRLAQVKSLLGNRYHLEKRRGTAQQAADYCSKDDPEPWTYGSISVREQGRRSDLDALHASLQEKKSLEEISNEHFGSFLKYQRGITAYKFANAAKRNWITEVHVLWGSTGTGKTRYVYEHENNVYPHAGGQWFDGYEGQEIVLFDDFAGSEFKLQYLLKLLDRYPMQVPIKGGFVQWAPKKVYITSNLDPDEWYRNAHPEHQQALKRRFTTVQHFQ